MKISIIIPVYNSSLTLNECLNSIFSSKYYDFEVIVVSGNSTDNSVEIAKKYKTKIIELTENKGPALARNRGAEIAEGEILLFIDSDVIINKDTHGMKRIKYHMKQLNKYNKHIRYELFINLSVIRCYGLNNIQLQVLYNNLLFNGHIK